MRKKQGPLVVLLISVATLIGGCGVELLLVGAGAAGAIAYVRGDLQATESESIDAVYEASLKALDDLGLHITSKSKDALVAQITTFDAQDKRIRIKLKAATDRTTKLSIRIGTFGSETKSRLIYQKIRDNLRENRESQKAEAEQNEKETEE